MCLVCLEWNKGTITISEGMTNLDEMENSLDKEHYDEVYDMLTDALIEEPDGSPNHHNFDHYLGIVLGTE